MKTILSICIVLLMLTHHASAQAGSVNGQVIDASSKESIPGAIVTLVNRNLQCVTDMSGRYSFENISPGRDSVVIAYTGYQHYSISIVVQEAEDLVLVHKIEPGVFELHSIQVSAEPELQAKAISDIDIQLRSTNTSQDILRMVPGLFIAQHAGGGKAEQIFLRGFDIDHGTDIEISSDGMPVNMVSHAHGQGYADLHFLIPETVDRVHFGKGPYHMHHGNLATAGFVGFQTFNTLDENTLSFQTGQFNAYRGLALVKLLDQHHGAAFQNAYVAAEYNTTNNYFESPQDFHRANLFGKFNGSVGKSNYLTISGSTFKSDWDASGQVPLRAVESGLISYFGAIDNTEGGKTTRSNGNVQLITTLKDQSWFKNQVYYSNYAFELYSNFTFFLNDSINGDQIKQKEHRNLFGYKGSYSREDNWFGKQFTSELGLVLRNDYSRDNELSHTADRTTILDRLSFGDIRETNMGAYLNETIRLTSRFTVNTGVRYDHFNFSYADHLTASPFKTVYADILSPKLNAYYQLTEDLQLSGNVGYGFHSNDTRVVVRQESFETLPRALGTDIGTLWKPFSKLIISASLWRLVLDQEFVYVGDEAVVEPSGKTIRKGVEFSGRMEVFKWLYADVDVNYTIARSADEPEGQNYIPLAPKMSSIGGITVKTEKHWSGSLRYRFLGDRAATEDNTVIAAGYTVFDFLLNYRVKKYEFGITVDNVFNTRWREAQFDTESRLLGEPVSVSEIHFTPGTPFNLRAHVAYHF